MGEGVRGATGLGGSMYGQKFVVETQRSEGMLVWGFFLFPGGGGGGVGGGGWGVFFFLFFFHPCLRGGGGGVSGFSGAPDGRRPRHRSSCRWIRGNVAYKILGRPAKTYSEGSPTSRQSHFVAD